MKIYHISQNKNTGYDTYSDAVVCAENEAEAREIEIGDPEYSWALPNEIEVEYLGEADKKLKRGRICTSFHAG